MNPAELHLALNHFPVFGAVFVALLLVWGLMRRSRDVMRAALGLTVLVSIGSYVAVATGEKAEHYVEDAAWFDEAIAHDHEELGELAFKAMLVTGLIGLIGLWQLRGDREPKPLWPAITLVALLISTGLVGWAAAKGGQIRHEEIRAGAVSPGPATLDVDEDSD